MIALPAGDHRPIILLVDDCVEQRDLYELALSDDVRVITAARGEQAMALARSEHPDAIVLDIMMPGMDGWEVCQRLKAHPATSAIPIIFLTANEDSQLAAHARDVGACAALAKPCAASELLQTIRAAVQKTAD